MVVYYFVTVERTLVCYSDVRLKQEKMMKQFLLDIKNNFTLFS